MLKQIILGIVFCAGLLHGTAWGDETLNKALFDAVESGNQAQVMTLIAKGANVNAKSNDGATPLHMAAGYGYKGVAELLLSKGADLNATYSHGLTPLHLAASSGHKTVTKLLIAKGANVNAKSDGNDGLTPLFMAWIETMNDKLSSAEIKEYEEVIQILKSNGATEE